MAPQLPSGIARMALWPIAVLLVLHRVAALAFPGTLTDDFTTVYSALRRFLEGKPVYEQAYHHVDPLYLYNPGATLLLSPLGMIGSLELARDLFILANTAAILGALAILLRLVGQPLNTAAFPGVIIIAFCTEAVRNTLAFTNINGLLFFALAVFLSGFIGAELTPQRGSRRIIAGIALGLSILIKPQFAPLLFLPLVLGRWRVIAPALTIPLVFNAIAWPLIPGAHGYADKLLPYLSTTRDYANSSWTGAVTYFDIPRPLSLVVWVAVAACVAIALLVLLRWRYSDPAIWALHSSGVLLAGVFFLSSLGQQYYSMWLMPMMFSFFLHRSVFHWWGAWVAAFLFLSPVNWASLSAPTVGRWITTFSSTAGWGLLLGLTAATVLGWWIGQRVHTDAVRD